MSKVNEAMQTLTAQWYNALVTGIGVDPEQFQLYQGPNSLMNTSQAMWDMFDTVPPTTANNYYNPGGANNFSSDYNLILTALVAGDDSSFQNCLGDSYADWQKYFSENIPEKFDADAISALFTKWAMVYSSSNAGCVTALTKSLINPISTAINMFAEAGGKFPWDRTIDDLKSALAGGQPKTAKLDSSTDSSDLSHTWAKASGSVLFDIFSFGGGGSYDTLTEKTTTAGLTVNAKFQKVTTFASKQYSQSNPNDPVLSKYKPWYYGAALSYAYSTKDNTVWNNQNPITWEKAFGDSGFLQRETTALVVADGIDIEITSSASYSSDEQTEIKAAAEGGIWPFFSAKGSGGHTTKVTFNDDGTFTSTTNSPLGNPQILGILQSSMSDIFS